MISRICLIAFLVLYGLSAFVPGISDTVIKIFALIAGIALAVEGWAWPSPGVPVSRY